MQIALAVVAMVFSFACSADPMMRTSVKRAPLQGKVKILRSSGYGTQREPAALAFNTEYYWVDSFSNTGLILYSHLIVGGIIKGRTEYNYDSNGNKIEECIYGEHPEEPQCRSFTYDTLGNIIEERTFFSWNDIIVTKYTYKGRQLISKESNVESITYRYNIMGQLIAEEQYYKGGGRVITKYAYDSKERILSETLVFSTGPTYTTNYTYDDHNNEILAKELFDGQSGRRFVSEYVYDSQGNWVSCIEDEPNDTGPNRTRKSASVREIEYY